MDTPTHILIHYRNAKTTQLFRASDGMLLGMKTGQECRLGEDPVKATTRLFINDDKSLEYLKASVGTEGVVFDEREGEPMIQVPNGKLAGMRN